MWPKNIAPWAQSIAQIGPVAARLVANFRFEIPTKKFTWSVFLRGIFPLLRAGGIYTTAAPDPYEFIGFGGGGGQNPYEFIGILTIHWDFDHHHHHRTL